MLTSLQIKSRTITRMSGTTDTSVFLFSPPDKNKELKVILCQCPIRSLASNQSNHSQERLDKL